MIFKILNPFFYIFGYRWQKLTTREEVCHFLRVYYSFSRALEPINEERVQGIYAEVLVKGHSYGLFKNGKLIAGYAYNPLKESRWYKYIIQKKLSIHFQNPEACIDLNFVFLNPVYKNTILSSYLWLTISSVMGGLTGYTIVYNADISKPKLLDLYKKVSDGDWGVYEVPEISSRFKVLWGTPRSFRQIPFSYIGELIKRALKLS